MKKNRLNLVFYTAAFITLLMLLSINYEARANEVSILEQNDEKIVLKNLLDQYLLEPIERNNVTFHIFDIKDYGSTIEVGKPQLPVNRLTLAIPPSSEIGEITILESTYSILDGYTIYPLQPQLIDGTDDSNFTINETFYDMDLYYPDQLVNVSNPAIMNGIKMIQVSFYPVQFNPYRNQVKVYDVIEIEIELVEGEIVNTFTLIPFLSVYNSMLLNFDFMVNWYSPEIDYFNTQSFLLNVSSITDLGNRADYLIITNDIFYESLLPLAEWKIMKGLETKIVNLSEIYANFPHPENNESIKLFLKYAYNNWELPPSYVLLVGDVEYLPTNYGLLYEYETEYGIKQVIAATDLYYSTLAGIDYFPDVSLGRFSVKNTYELDTIINKVISYEKNPFMSNINWYKKASVFYSTERYRWKITADWIQAKLTANSYTVNKWNETEGNTARMASEINDGLYFLSYRGHGSVLGWGIFHNYDVQNLANDRMSPVVFSTTCNTGWFDNTGTDCFGEVWIKKPAGGAIAFLGSSRESFTGHNDELAKGFYKAIFDDGIYDLSGIITRGKQYMSDSCGDHDRILLQYEEYNLFGDPELWIWTDVPKNMLAMHPSTVYVGSNTITVTVQNEAQNPLENAVVTLWKKGEVYQHKKTDWNGEVTFDINPQSMGQMRLTVVLHNYIPYLGNITVVVPDVVYVDDDNTQGPWYGTPEHPFKFIQDGIDTVNELNTVYVLDGTYNENLFIDKTINLIGENKNSVIIHGEPYEDVINLSASNAHLRGFTITDGCNGISLWYAHNNTLTDCIIQNNMENGIQLNQCSKNNSISMCEIYTNFDNGIEIKYCFGGNTIINCSIHHNSNSGIFLDYSSRNAISTCSIHDNLNGIIIISEDLEVITPLHLGLIALSYGSHPGDPCYEPLFDCNQDGVIDAIDLTCLSDHWGTSGPSDPIFGHSNHISDCDIYDNSFTGVILNGTYHFYSDNWAPWPGEVYNRNKIYHNNFSNNGQNACDYGNNTWDNGYPSGGNYWDDYSGSDTNDDGIGDEPYPIPCGISQDRYPWVMFETGIANVSFPLTALIQGPYSIYVGSPTQFTGTAVDGMPPYTFAWDFDYTGIFTVDSILQNPTWVYTSPGIRTVALRITDAANTPDMCTILCNVINYPINPPIASVSPVLQEVTQGSTFCVEIRINSYGNSVRTTGFQLTYPTSFTIESFTYENLLGPSVVQMGVPIPGDNSGFINYAVSRVDGGAYIENGKLVTICFSLKSDTPEGTYLLDLHDVFLVDGSGDPITDTNVVITDGTIIVTTPPVAQCNGPYSGIVGSSVSFMGSATGGTSPYTFAWDFNYDGTFNTQSTLQNPTYTYTMAGTYTVALRVTDSITATNMCTATAIISPYTPTTPPYIQVSPTAQTSILGDSFCIEILVNSDTHTVRTVAFQLNYNSTWFTVDTFIYEDLLGTSVIPMGVPSPGDNSGFINYAVSRTDGGADQENGKIVTICFSSKTGIPGGTYPLDIHDVILVDGSDDVIGGVTLVDGEVSFFIDEQCCSCIFGDCDCDCDIDLLDLDSLAQAWDSSVGDGRFRECVDCDGDGYIGIFDLDYFAQHWGMIYCDCDYCCASWCECKYCLPWQT